MYSLLANQKRARIEFSPFLRLTKFESPRANIRNIINNFRKQPNQTIHF